MQRGFKKYQNGNSGPFTEEYHNILGASPWIYVKRLLPPSFSSLTTLSSSPSTATYSPSMPHLSEGDVVTVFSQFGEVEDIRFVRHHKTGRFLGTAFIRFKDYRSSIIAADTMNSNFETGELCILYSPSVISNDESSMASASSSSSNSLNGHRGAGIIVERCQENEVPLPHSMFVNGKVDSYPQWQAKCVPSITLFWTPGF